MIIWRQNNLVIAQALMRFFIFLREKGGESNGFGRGEFDIQLSTDINERMGFR